MAPRKKNASIKNTGSTSSKAEPLPDWVKNKNIAKPPSKFQQIQSTNGPVSKNGGALQADVSASRPPPLFPPGTKTPINLLNERIQKHHAPKGWLRPIIEAKKASPRKINGPEGIEDYDHSNYMPELWTFVVILTKTNKSDQSNPFIVKFDARDPSGSEGSYIALDTKEKAKHWGATYALFRLYSNLSLDSILPTGPKEYWKNLADHKAKAPEHLSWLWSPDPFDAAQRLLLEKEAKKHAIEKEKKEQDQGPRLARRWVSAPEIRMAKALRDMVEDTVKDALRYFPIRNESEKSFDTAEAQNQSSLFSRLIDLGFRKGHADSAIRWLTLARQGQIATDSTLPMNSIANLSDTDACLEYLGIFCPEEDLPKSFRPSIKSESFVTQSASGSGDDNLAERWIEERLVKVAGFPRAAVAETLRDLSSEPLTSKEGSCIDILLRRLALKDVDAFKELRQQNTIEEEQKEKRSDERFALEAVLGAERIQEIPSSERPLTSCKRPATEIFDIIISDGKDEDLRLRICPGDISLYPSANVQAVPTFIVTSRSIPAYIRLALTKQLMNKLTDLDVGCSDWHEILEAGQGGVILSMVEELEYSWKHVVDNPPELSDVMTGLITKKQDRQKKAGPSSEFDRRVISRRPRVVTALEDDEKVNKTLLSNQIAMWDSAKYKKIAETRSTLPAMASREEIVQLLASQRLLIISGETGCGKTTQCPQFVLDHYIQQGKGSMCNVVVTQPRRLSAMGVASRVATERCESLDSSGQVGYSIRGETKAGKNTRLLFTTTGVLLRRLRGNDPDLQGVSHVFVDEVHERGVDSDLLLLELREVLKRNANIRIILMSATIEKETFTSYFRGAPSIDIPGRTFPVHDYYLENIFEMLGQDIDERINKGKKIDIDYDILGQTIDMICKRASVAQDTGGGILVFCPGVGEIRVAIETIKHHVSNVEVLPLHANLSPDEQRRVFSKPKEGLRKVIVSTNVAETSITIDDISYVVDLGLVKETRYDSSSGLTRLVLCHCSQANARQRRGRAGRVRKGECFKLYTRHTEQHRMQPQQIPEMNRMSLENLVLSVKALKGDGVQVSDYLGAAISPPSTQAISTAVKLLSDMNILDEEQRLSSLGKHLSLLPLDVRLGKLLVLGCVFHCVEPMLSASAVLSGKPLFIAPFENREEAAKARSKFSVGQSDILTDVNAFQQWDNMRKNGNSALRSWCETNFLSSSAMRDVINIRSDLQNNLVEMGFIPPDYSKHRMVKYQHLNANSGDLNLHRALLLAALYPSVVRIVHPQLKYDKSIAGTVEREAEARQVRFLDSEGQRVFLHPSSVLFSQNKFTSGFLASFRRGVSQHKDNGTSASEKIYLRDVTEVPMFSLLLFGGQLHVHRMEGGISMGSLDSREGSQEGWIRIRANVRIIALVNQLRHLLDAALADSFEDPVKDVFSSGTGAQVRDCLYRILEYDGQQ